MLLGCKFGDGRAESRYGPSRVIDPLPIEKTGSKLIRQSDRVLRHVNEDCLCDVGRTNRDRLALTGYESQLGRTAPATPQASDSSSKVNDASHADPPTARSMPLRRASRQVRRPLRSR